MNDTLRRDDLTPTEQRNFLARNFDRLSKAFVSSHPHLRIRVLACSRKTPQKLVRLILRKVLRDEVIKRLQGATLAEVDELLDEFLMPASAIAELRATSKPRFITMTRKPEFRAKQFPERDARPRDPHGRLVKRRFSPFEVDRLYFLREVLLLVSFLF